MTEQRQTTSPNRRDFLATAAATGTALAAGLSWVSNVHAAGGDEIKVGVIGCGGRGSGAAENVLHSSPNVKIVALGDVFKSRVHDLRGRLQNLVKKDAIKKLGNTVDLPDDRLHTGLDAYKKVLAEDVNYVILATPPGFRPPHLEAAVAAGKNVFTEKPVGVDGPGIRKVLAAHEEALKKGLGVGAGTQRRHQLGYLETLKRLEDGVIGDITALRAYWNNSHDIWFHNRDDMRKELARSGEEPTELAYQIYNWYHFMWLCGDHIVEQHVHNLDVCNWVMKDHPVHAIGMGGRAARPHGDPADVGNIYDNFAVDFVYPNGVHMLSMCRQLNGGDDNVTEAQVGTKGVCLTRDGDWTIEGKRVISKEEAKAAVDPYVQEHRDLIASIRSGKPYNELKNVAESTLTAILGRTATYTGKPVKWDQVLHSQLDTMPKELTWNMKLEVAPVPVPGKTRLV
jgi:predicted dehydrogenase